LQYQPHSGGTRDVATATPASPSEILFDLNQERSNRRSIRVGFALAVISSLITFMGEIRAIKIAVKKIIKTDFADKITPLFIYSILLKLTPIEICNNGHIKGEIIIPPIITGPLAISKPKVEIIVEQNNKIM
jgi:hypothetical protein